MRIVRANVAVAAVWVALSVLSAPLALAAPPSPEDIASARAHYKRGVQLYEQGSYTEALAELRRADQLAPTYKLLYNLALVQMRLGDWAGAIRSFESYLDGGGAEIAAARRSEVERLLAEATAHAATISVTANVDGAQITVDDVIVGTTPHTAPLRLNPGPHRIQATKGMTSVTKEIDLANGDRLDVALTLNEAPVPAPALVPEPPSSPPVTPATEPPVVTVPAAPPPPTPHANAPASTWVGWVVTGALAAGSVATGIAALAESHTLGDELATPTSGSTIHSTHATTVGLALASDVLGGAALVAGGVTLYFTLAAPAPSASASATRGSSVPPAGVCVAGRF